MTTKAKIKQTAFRFDEELLALVKEKADAQKRTLNNYIEVLLLKDVGKIPNEETKLAIAEVMSGKKLEEITDIDSFMDSL
ncbi:hypothetical protein DHD32_19390 [Arenibacter sp. TNZ]|uniref:hypothetical protein n=1 Tax=Arenibacter TaxID=178469 RepID=UPI000CD40D81|nr:MULTISPECIES: hypothetical protein [Arenibacter]MCM4173645.1 hypothetical protein [Arenibacter sp. TNZ]